jgi:uncharacterized protein (DUF362 family)
MTIASSSSAIAEEAHVSVQSGGVDYRDPGTVQRVVLAALEDLRLAADFVRPGDRVVLKPNWVKEHDERYPGPDQWEHMVTHPAVIEAVARWVGARLQGQGRVTLCDAPQTDSSFARLREYCRLDDLVRRCERSFPGVEFVLLDLRPEEWHAVDGVTVRRTELEGDPRGSTRVALDGASEFVGFAGLGRLYGASYDMEETNARHSGNRHEYLLCRTPMEADVFINLPKLKTHKKVGLTCALKNLVGINANKNWLPHHTEGTPDEGGDQFPEATVKARLEHSWMGAIKRFLRHRPRLSRWFVPLKKVGRLWFGDTQQVVRSGNWHGNDTCWRMVLDLNQCLFSFDGDGHPRSHPLRYLAVVDGIVAGEGNGPMAPDPKPCGVIVAGRHPAAVDCVASALMGFDWAKLRLLKRIFGPRPTRFASFGVDDIRVTSNRPEWCGALRELRQTFSFRPHFGWVGAIERDSTSGEPHPETKEQGGRPAKDPP